MASHASEAETKTEVSGAVGSSGHDVITAGGRPWDPLDLVIALAIAAVIAVVAFVGNGGLQLGSTTTVEVLVDAVACLTIVASIMLVGFGPRLSGGLALFAVAALGALTALSILWSLFPADSWIEANRTLCYAAAFAAGIALVRLIWNRWTTMLVGVLAALTVISFYGLATKIVPGLLAPDEIFTRLREPYGYWNAVGVTAAMGMPLALWLGTRDQWGERVSALGSSLIGLLVVALMMSYSRASIIAAAAALALWFVFVPLRLRSISVLVPALTGGGLITAWAFSQSALSDDRVSLTRREDAGVIFGLVLIVVLAALYVTAYLIARRGKSNPLSVDGRRKAGIASLAVVGVLGILTLAAIGTTGGGFSGRWHDLTQEPGTPTNDANRLTEAGSVRTVYWARALDVWGEQRFKGSGAGAFDKAQLRFRDSGGQGRHAHGYVHQTLADLGWLGFGVSMLGLGAWLFAASSTLGLRPKGWGANWSDERVGAAALTLVAITFGVHSFLDWTWFVPAIAVTGMFVAGWVAGRGPIDDAGVESSQTPTLDRSPLPKPPNHRTFWRRAPIAVAVILAGVALIGTTLQPWRAARQSEKALRLATEGDFQAASEAAQRSKELNPLSPAPYFDLAAIAIADRDNSAAQDAFQQAVQREPASPEAWRRLGDFYLNRLNDPEAAVPVLRGALYLDPFSPAARGALLVALRAQQVKQQERQARREARRALRGLRKQAAAGQLPGQTQQIPATP